MNICHKSARIAVIPALAMALTTLWQAEALPPQPAFTIEQLAGQWQITIVGNTGCGQSSLLFTGNLNPSGTGTGTLTGSSGCRPFPTSSTQTFTITSLNAIGAGKAALSCGSGCGWNFDIQVKGDRQMFNLVDVTNGSGNVLAGTAVRIAEGTPPITVDQLAGRWQITLVGNTGCGQSSLLFTGNLNANGTGTGTLTGSSGCNPSPSSSTQTFTITSLNADGSGTAALSCGSGCGWNFDIQVDANKQTFNLVDVTNGSANVLAGTAVAVAEGAPAITADELARPWQITLVGNTGCGRSSMLFSGTLHNDAATGTVTGTGTLTAESGCSPSPSTSTQTFTITSLNGDGSGTAALSCGSGCGWNFDIQVDADKQMFNLVDVTNGGANVLAGTAVAEPAGFVRVPDLVGDNITEAEEAAQAAGLLLKANDSGNLVVTQTPGAGAWVPVGSTVSVELVRIPWCGRLPCP
ncbi:MAG: PASTA domain-containing protein [Acidobacteriaceae bacterium]|nr:PASTA domain-containing protein [Acidobacteriaceae bacterium]